MTTPGVDGDPAREAALASRGSGIRLAAEVVGRALSIATTFLIVAGLGVESYGVFAALSGVAVIVAEAANLGLQGTANRALATEELALAAMLRAKALFTALALVAAFLLPQSLAALGPAVTPLLPDAWRAAGGLGFAQAWLLLPLILFFVLAGWSEFLGVALRARGHRLAEAATILCLRVSGLLAVAVALHRRAGLMALGWAHVLSSAPPLLLSAVLARRAWADRPDRGARPAPRAILRQALPLAVNDGLALLSLRIELLVVFWLRGAREAGLFGAALKVIESLNAIPAAITAGAMPSLSREAQRARTQAAVRSRTAATIALLAVPSAAGLALLAPGLMPLLGGGYVEAAAPLRVLALAVVCLYMNTLLLNGLIAIGRAHWLPRLTAARVGAAFSLALLLVPGFGVIGAAAGFLASELLLTLLAERACLVAGFEMPVWKPLAAAACISLPMAFAVKLFGGGPLASTMLGAAVYAGTLLAALRLLPRSAHRLLGAGGELS